MTLLESIITGILQGISAMWPISADGHLAMVNYFFGFSSPLGLGFILQAALVLAVCIGFAKEIWQSLRHPNWVHFSYYAIVAVPFLALLLIEAYNFPQYYNNVIWLVPLLLVGNGVLLIVADGFQKRKETGELTYWGAIFISLVQLLAILPGLSHLGLVLFAALVWGFKREEAVKFAFLVSLPINLMILLGRLFVVYRQDSVISLSVEEIAGGIAAFVAATFAVFFFKKLALHKLTGYAVYCFGIAAVLMVLLFLGM